MQVLILNVNHLLAIEHFIHKTVLVENVAAWKNILHNEISSTDLKYHLYSFDFYMYTAQCKLNNPVLCSPVVYFPILTQIEVKRIISLIFKKKYNMYIHVHLNFK